MNAIVRMFAPARFRGIAVLIVSSLAALALVLVVAQEVKRELQAEELRSDSATAARNARRAAVAGFALPAFVLAYGLFYRRRANQEGLMVARSHIAALQEREEQLRKAIEERDARKRQMDEQQLLLLSAARIAELGVWTWDVATNLVTWSDEIYRTFGVEQETFVPTYGGYLACIHPDDRKTVEERIGAAVANQQPYALKHRVTRPDGTVRVVYAEAEIETGPGGETIRLIGTARDITKAEDASAAIRLSEERFQLATRATNDTIWDLNLTTNEIWLSERFETQFGYPHEDRTRFEMWLRTIHPEDIDRIQTTLSAALQGTASFWSGEFRFVDFHGIWREVLNRAFIVRDDAGRAVRMIGAMVDISSRLAVDRMKDEFISTVSHELRTPLTSIRGAIGLLASGRVGTLSEKGQRLADLASTNTDRLVRLINDILDIERIESGKVPVVTRPCVATDLIQQAVDVVRPLADREQIRIETAGRPVAVLADPDRIVQTLTNLISNGVKFSPAGSTIRVAAEEKEGSVLFTVSDEGRGVPPDQRRSIFERFQQVDAADSREKGGSGLGLAISASIVKQHGGEIWVKSEPGAGSVFSFTIPSAHGEMSPVGMERPKRVLLCDDDDETRGLIATILTGHGYSVREAPSGQDLLAAAVEEKPDAILLDLFMPDLNGWEALARLRSDPATADIPVVIVSVLSPDEMGLPFTSLSGWVQKPLDADTLLTAITNAFRSDARRPRIVLIEDDLDLARVIATSFERYGVEMFHAENGAEAIELASRIDPDLVVLDLVLPDIDGFQIVDWLKRHNRWCSVPLVVYSALEPTTAEQERLVLGCTEFFTKSRISPEAFEQRIGQLLDKIIESSNGAILHAS